MRRHTKDYFWALAMAAGVVVAHMQAHPVIALLLAFSSGFTLMCAFDEHQRHYEREIERIGRGK